MATTIASAAAVDRRTSTPSVFALSALAALGAAAVGLTVWGIWRSPVASAPETTAIVKGLSVAAYVAVGAYTWWRRPQSRLGPLVVVAGLLMATTTLTASTNQLSFTLGRVALAVLVAYFVYLFLCFPRDRLGSALERQYVLVFAGASAAVWTVVLLLSRTMPRGGAFSDCATTCPANPLRLVNTSEAVSKGLNLGANGLTALGLAGVIILLLHKAASPAHLRRRAVAPLLGAATIFAAAYATYSVLSEADVSFHAAPLRVITAIGALAIPLALLVGQFRGRIFAATNLWRLLADAGSRRFTPVWVEGILGSSLGDRSFALALWDPELNGYVDAQGEPLELPESTDARSVTRIQTDGRPPIALLHDPSLNDEPEIVQGLGATAAMLLENARLVEEVQASRARIAETAEGERFRLERDLHDGAQQRLMAIQIKLALARRAVTGADLVGQLDELEADASAAVDELRTLAHGIYPPILRERGVADAFRAFAKVVPIPVHVHDEGVGRLASGVEAAIYYCSLEAIQNVVKHAGPEATVTLTLARPDGRIVFEVSDDGTGFEPSKPLAGFGLVSMHDRIAAVGGELSVDSSPGGGTTVLGSIPVGYEPVPDRPES
jgi:signal transduction histidine kinase